MTMTEHLEIEQKFDVGEGFERPDFGLISGVTAATPVTYHLVAVYYDTPDGRLAAAKATLRHREGGTDEGWHLKLPVSAGTRREIHAPLSDELPRSLAGRVAEVTGGAPVAPIASLHTERVVVTLTSRGNVVAEVADDTVTGQRLSASGTDAGEPMRWREIEVEVPEPSPAVQEAAAKLLASAGARPSDRASKLARVLAG
jgi:inorganic triphosphatase YgiF